MISQDYVYPRDIYQPGCHITKALEQQKSDNVQNGANLQGLLLRMGEALDASLKIFALLPT